MNNIEKKKNPALMLAEFLEKAIYNIGVIAFFCFLIFLMGEVFGDYMPVNLGS